MQPRTNSFSGCSSFLDATFTDAASDRQPLQNREVADEPFDTFTGNAPSTMTDYLLPGWTCFD